MHHYDRDTALERRQIHEISINIARRLIKVLEQSRNAPARVGVEIEAAAQLISEIQREVAHMLASLPAPEPLDLGSLTHMLGRQEQALGLLELLESRIAGTWAIDAHSEAEQRTPTALLPGPAMSEPHPLSYEPLYQPPPRQPMLPGEFQRPPASSYGVPLNHAPLPPQQPQRPLSNGYWAQAAHAQPTAPAPRHAPRSPPAPHVPPVTHAPMPPHYDQRQGYAPQPGHAPQAGYAPPPHMQPQPPYAAGSPHPMPPRRLASPTPNARPKNSVIAGAGTWVRGVAARLTPKAIATSLAPVVIVAALAYAAVTFMPSDGGQTEQQTAAARLPGGKLDGRLDDAQSAASPIAPGTAPGVVVVRPPGQEDDAPSAAPMEQPYLVVLTTRPSLEELQKDFDGIKTKYEAILSETRARVDRLEGQDRKMWYRLSVVPPRSHEDAKALCSQLKAAGLTGCWIRAVPIGQAPRS